MPQVTGRDAVKRYIASIPPAMRDKVLRGAAKAAANVVAEEAKARSISPEVSEAIVIRSKLDGDRIIVRITVKGRWPTAVGTWLEWGTDPHFISVDDSQRGGMSVGRINELHREGSLVIGGKFVGKTVHHPGARAHPFLRPALDIKEAEAIKAAQGYITTRIAREGLGGPSVGGEDE